MTKGARASAIRPALVMGLGVIGRAIARAALSSRDLELVGALDQAPELVGRSLRDVLGVGPDSPVMKPGNEALRRAEGGVLLHATSSRVSEVADAIVAAVRAGLSVVSTCEELAFPWLHHAADAERIDQAAISAGVTVLGTGVNPGFVLDRLVATAGQACGPVRHASACRVVDARTRRAALKRKVGAGLTEEEFERRLDREELGHIGLPESCALAALGLGFDCDEYEEEITPVIADEDIADSDCPVGRGRVAGVEQTARAFSDGREVVELKIVIALGAERPGDEIVIDADPPLRLRIDGGIAGEAATAWSVVNAAPRVLSAEPGLLTVLDLPAGR
jgi:2,4-diaminopentanoate dehydrogenase